MPGFQIGFGIGGPTYTPEQIGQGVQNVGNWFGLGDPNVNTTALDFTQANQTRDAQTQLIAQLQAAVAGNGPTVAQGLLQRATDDQMSNAMALGAAQQGQGLGYGAALRQIADQRARIGQQSAGQAALLRAQEQQTAMGQLAQTLLGVRGLDQSQAGMTGENAYRYEALRHGAEQNAQANRRDLVGNIINPLGAVLKTAAGFSRGGKVPGYAEGGMPMDSQKNDTVPAMLSPGEIVIPRSITMGENAPERAAAFVREVMKKQGGGPHPLMKMAEMHGKKMRKAA